MGGLLGSDPPSPPKPPPPPPPAKDDNDDELSELARKRKSLDANRTGRSKLVVPRDNKQTAGLRILE